MKLLPFNFEFIDSDIAFLSNEAGFFEYLNRSQLESLVSLSSTGTEELDLLLESKLFLTSPNSSGVSVNALASGMSKRLMKALQFNPIFMIVPTLRCDHTCRYCQVSRASIHARNFDMEESNITPMMEQIKTLSSPPYKLEIQGGEPLIRFDLVQKIYDSAVSILGEEQFEFVIATSLSLLTDEIVSWSEAKAIHFSTSLDGSHLIHNSHRILGNGDSFERVKLGIQKIKSSLGDKHVATVTTVTSALLPYPEDIISTHTELGLNDIFIRPVSPYGFANHDQRSTYSIDEYISFYERFLNVLSTYHQRGYKLVEHSALIHLKRILDPNYSSYSDLKSPSGVILNSILFNYDGRIFGSDEARMLQKSNSDIDFSLGTIQSPNVSNNQFYRSVLSQSFSLCHPGCIDCAYQPFCGADPCQNISVFGEPVGDKSQSRFCQYHKAMFTLVLKHYRSKDEVGQMFKEWIYG
ncbi:His-Xaa-Ser system radical SAM maturase HxsB [Vibrio fluvialis]|nr:His-Xaa-Ser system radical SAM maturase HxsB [Vibrio fluvialis]